MLKANTKIVVRGQDGGYTRYIIIPHLLAKDSQFPFTDDDPLIISINENSIVIEKDVTDEIRKAE